MTLIGCRCKDSDVKAEHYSLPEHFLQKVHSFNCMLGLNISGMSNFSFLISHYSCFACVQIRHNPLSGGYCGGVPPLPIPNREVKPTCADGTAMQCGRVGRRLLSMKSLRFRKISEAFLFFFPQIFFFSAVFFFSLNISLSRRFRR